MRKMMNPPRIAHFFNTVDMMDTAIVEDQNASQSRIGIHNLKQPLQAIR
jgi:hypothetical protein